MHAFLVRHAEAIEETLAVRDPHRYLSPHGRIQARGLGDRLRWHDCTPSHVWTSPLVRAVQTAELVMAGIDNGAIIEVITDLAPDGSVRALLAALEALPPEATVLLVGHEPSLSAIGGLLVGRALDALGRAQALRIDDDRPRWRLAWDGEAPERLR